MRQSKADSQLTIETYLNKFLHIWCISLCAVSTTSLQWF